MLMTEILAAYFVCIQGPVHLGSILNPTSAWIMNGTFVQTIYNRFSQRSTQIHHTNTQSTDVPSILAAQRVNQSALGFTQGSGGLVKSFVLLCPTSVLISSLLADPPNFFRSRHKLS